MPDKFSILPVDKLLKWILEEEKTGQIFGITKKLFFNPQDNDVFKINRYGKTLDTPIGVAAGPHTQLSQNIITAYLTGSRFIELKTIQTLDKLEISKPCIDMEDEGYNCEWSQELKLTESFSQYLDAWIILHILNHKFGWSKVLNCIFNMSVGYNMKGILRDNVKDFISKMLNARKDIDEKLNLLEKIYPRIKDINIPDKISDNITLSTMHGCPPYEIEKMAKYFIEEIKLHTAVKLNPTLLGYENINDILKFKLGYDTVVPKSAFEHDLKYSYAEYLIKSLQETAKNNNVMFSVKLTNTLECINNKSIFPEKEKMMYMSGRALHPVSIELARKLQNDFTGELDISFSAGADCFNISDILACGIKPVTVCSDLLKPGGYARQKQYLENIRKEFDKYEAKNIDEFIIRKNPESTDNVKIASLNNLNKYSGEVIHNEHFRKSFFAGTNIKTKRNLFEFDCINAPCVYTCPDSQNIPDYMYYTSTGEIDMAFQVVLKSNPFPSVTGMICDHLCQTKCTRLNYDNPLLIREVKRFIAENANVKDVKPKVKNGKKVTIIGAGPSGLSAAYFLALEGFEVEVFDSKSFAGGMVSDVIPEFRLSKEAIRKDIGRIEELGVRFNYNIRVNDETLKNIIDNLNNNFLYIAVGAQKNKKLNIPGEENEKVIDALKFLSDIRKNIFLTTNESIAVIGGGNTAVDTARTAKRLSGNNVTLIYRRTRKEMPADKDEIKAMLDEGIKLLELTAPLEIKEENDKLKLTCCKMKLSGKDKSGRAAPEKIPDLVFKIEFDKILPAIGQEVASEFLGSLKVNTETCETQFKNVYLGGDALRGSSTLIKAIADGKNISRNILNKVRGIVTTKNETASSHSRMSPAGIHSKDNEINNENNTQDDFQIKNATRIFGEKIIETHVFERNSFELVTKSLTRESAQKESVRCLYCDVFCNACVTVCPNRAFISYIVKPDKYKSKKIIVSSKNLLFKEDFEFEIKQEYQVLNINDFCNECGNCTTFCPTNGEPYKNKPRLYFNKKDFQNCKEGYFCGIVSNKKFIEYKSGIKTERIVHEPNCFEYQHDDYEIRLDLKDLRIIKTKIFKPMECEISLRNAVKMCILLMYLPEYLFLK